MMKAFMSTPGARPVEYAPTTSDARMSEREALAILWSVEGYAEHGPHIDGRFFDRIHARVTSDWRRNPPTNPPSGPMHPYRALAESLAAFLELEIS